MFGTAYVIFLLAMMSIPIVHTLTIHYKNFLNGVILGLRIITNQLVITVAQNPSGIWPGLFVVYSWCLTYFLLSLMINLGVFGVLVATTFYFMGTVFDMKNKCMVGLTGEQFGGKIDFGSKPVMKRPAKISVPPAWKFDSDESSHSSSCSTPPSSPENSPPSSQRSTSPLPSESSTPSSPVKSDTCESPEKSPAPSENSTGHMTQEETLEILNKVGNNTTPEEDLELLRKLANGGSVAE